MMVKQCQAPLQMKLNIKSINRQFLSSDLLKFKRKR